MGYTWLLNDGYAIFSCRALEAISRLGGEDLQPFYAMLDGGRDGEFFTELEEFFYYAQIRRYINVQWPFGALANVVIVYV